MKKLFTFFMTMVLAMVANAADIKPTAVIGEGAASLDALEGKTFAIVNKEEGKALFGSNAQNLGYDVYANAFVSTNSGYKWKLVSLAEDADESVHGYYLLQLITPTGADYGLWGNPKVYLNSQVATGGCSFILALNNQNGQDIKNGAVYDVQYVEGKGFSLKNIGTGLYQGANTLPANAEEPAYFDLVEEVGFNYIAAVKDLLAEGEALKATITNEAAKEAYDAAIADIDVDAIEGDGLAEANAIDAAISVLAKAQTTAGADMTRVIVNPSFETGNTNGWVSEGFGVAPNSDFPLISGVKYAEKWTGAPNTIPNVKITQEITGIPNGTYEVKAAMRLIMQDADPADREGLYLLANDKKVAVEAAGIISATANVTDNVLVIGAEVVDAQGNWANIDDFQLTLVEAIAEPTEKVQKKFALTGEITSVDALKGDDMFFLQNEEGLSPYTPSGWDIKSTNSPIEFGSDKGGYFKLEDVQVDGKDYFLVPVYNGDGQQRTFWAGKQYMNSQPVGGGVIFGLDGVNAQHGQDGPNLAVWDITYEEGKGFLFHNVGRDIYLGCNATQAFPSDDKQYFKAYTGFESSYDADEVLAAYKAALFHTKATSIKESLETAKAAYDEDAEQLAALVETVNNAIALNNALKATNELFGSVKLKGAKAQEMAAEVVASYKAGEIDNVAELETAYREAVKAQDEEGADMTLAIVNPSFETGNTNGWVSEGFGVAPNTEFPLISGVKYAEKWEQAPKTIPNVKITQEISGLPNGMYEVSAAMRLIMQNADPADREGLYLLANNEKVAVEAADVIKATAKVTNGTLVIGAEVVDAQGNWANIDDFKLTLLEPIAEEPVVAPAWYNAEAIVSKDFVRENASDIEAARLVKVDDEVCVAVLTNAPAEQPWDSQIFFVLDEEGLPAGTKFTISFDYKATADVKIGTQAHQEPGTYIFYQCIGDVEFTTEWQHFEKEVEVTEAFNSDGKSFRTIAFNLNENKEEAIEFYFNNVKWEVKIDEPAWYNAETMVAKDFVRENAEDIIAARLEKVDGEVCVAVLTNAPATNPWDSQIFFVLDEEGLPTGSKFTISFDYKANADVTVETQAHQEPSNYIFYQCIGNVDFTTEWQHFEKEVEVVEAFNSDGKSFRTIAFNLNTNKEEAIEFYFNNIKWDVTKKTIETSIEGVEAEAKVKDGKYVIDGQVVIIRNGKKYNAAGVQMK